MKNIILLFSFIGIMSPVFLNAQINSNQTVSSNYSPLHWAASQGYVEMIKVILDKGYDINMQDAGGFTPLHYAVASGKFDAVEFLVNQGADLYRVNKKNLTPMTLAAQAGEQKIVDYLFVKMRSTRVDQLKNQAEVQRVNTDLTKAAKARAEAERLRQQAEEWTKEADYWKNEAEKWTREANRLKEKQIQVDQLAKERLDRMMAEKVNAEENFRTERLARNAAERLLREQSASTDAQLRAYEAQNAALAAQKATDAAIDNLANEFLKQGIQYDPRTYNNTSPSSELPIAVPSGYQKAPLPGTGSVTPATQMFFLDSNAPSVPVDVLNQIPVPSDRVSLDLGATPAPPIITNPVPPITNSNGVVITNTNTNTMPMYGGQLPPGLTNLNYPDPILQTEEEEEEEEEELPEITEVTGLEEEEEETTEEATDDSYY